MRNATPGRYTQQIPMRKLAIALVMAASIAAAVGLAACGGSGSSSACIILANGGRKLCGQEAVAWCHSTKAIRQTSSELASDDSAIGKSIKESEESCRTIGIRVEPIGTKLEGAAERPERERQELSEREAKTHREAEEAEHAREVHEAEPRLHKEINKTEQEYMREHHAHGITEATKHAERECQEGIHTTPFVCEGSK